MTKTTLFGPTNGDRNLFVFKLMSSPQVVFIRIVKNDFKVSISMCVVLTSCIQS
jgi:hypothetical protein